MNKTLRLAHATRLTILGVALGVAFAAAPVAVAKESPATDCLVGVKDGSGNVLTGPVECTDGDPTCDGDGATDGKCVFKVQGCVNLPDVEGCTTQPLKKIKFKTKKAKNLLVLTPNTAVADSACTNVVDYTVPLAKKGKKDGKGRVVGNVKAVAKKTGDKDSVDFICKVCTTEGGCTNISRCPETCSNSQAGGPDQLVLTVATSGSDLDNGWTGNSQNFPLVPNGKIGLCLDNCDGVTDTTCDACGRVGAGTISGTTFGAPLPLFASNVPVCVISRWRDDIRGTVDEATGDTSITIKLFADTYLTSRDDVCPQCKNGKCNAAAGTNAGKACTVEATIPVFVSQSRTDTYELSSACVFSSAPTATLNIDFDPLTSGTTDPLVGPTPCTRQPGEPAGVPPAPDTCGGSGCGSTCTGLACVTTIDDPTNPGNQICVDSKGGVSQFCCNNNTARPCHKLANGGVVTRTGRGGVPSPALPDQTYPKTNDGILVSTFCIPATGTNTIDSVTGLPGPGIIQLPGDAVWSQQ